MLLLTMTAGNSVIVYLECSYFKKNSLKLKKYFFHPDPQIRHSRKKKNNFNPKKTHVGLQKFNKKCN